MPPLLELRNVSAGYGQSVVLRGLDLDVEAGQALAVLGRNGVGKTTLINTIVGLTRLREGTITLAGTDITRLPAERRAGAGVGWVPQERNIFRSLTVEENITAVARPGAWTLDRIYDMFPRLNERRRNMGSQLSGGEQQMLAVGRALALNPKLLLLDEPFEGLAPIIVEELSGALQRIVSDEGQSAIVVEQNARKVLAMTHRAVVIDRGSIVLADTSQNLLQSPERLEALLSVASAA